MKNNIFRSSLHSNIRKFAELHRVNLSLAIALLKYLLKAVTGAATTGEERQLYYYYLTLIHCKCKHEAIRDGKFYFSGSKLQFVARMGSKFSDLENLNQLFGRNEYQVLVNLYNDNFTSGPTSIIDAGANVGYATLFFNNCYPDAKFICIEPDKENFLLLQEHLRVNHLRNCTEVNQGLWNKDTYLALSTVSEGRGTWGFSFIESDLPTGVQAIDFKTMLAENGVHWIDILKIDVEGAEAILFSDEHYMKSILGNTKVIGIEIHDDLANRNTIIEQLKNAGFELRDIGDMTFGVNSFLK